MLTKPETGPRAWRACATALNQWLYPLPASSRTALDRMAIQVRQHPEETTRLRIQDFPTGSLAADLEPVRHALETGPGFVVMRGLTRERYTAAELQALYWLVGQMLGREAAQNVQGTLLYDVRDTGQDVRYGARFSVTNAESSFHTDNSFGADVVDYVGLLCLNTARAGGLSQVVSAYSVHNELLARHPDLLQLLYQPFHVDRRGGVRAGEEPTVRRPIFEWDGDQFLCRYLRYWIEAGQEKAGEPLTPTQVQALDTLDRIANDPALRAEFALEPGDIFFVNNRWILHNRTAFEDHAEPDKRRHLVRLWLYANPSQIRPGGAESQ